MEINIARDGIKNTDEATALIYYGRYEVSSWAELYFAAVKTLYIEYPEVINSLVSKDDRRDLYLRTTTINMQSPARLGTILYLDLNRQPEAIVRAIREIFHRAGVLNINMSIEIRRGKSIIKPPEIILTPKEIIKPQDTIQTKTQNPVQNPTKNAIASLEVPSFMKSTLIIKMSEKERYIDLMKSLAKKYPRDLRKQAGKYIIKRRVTLAESDYRYFKEPVDIGSGLSIELDFNDEELRQIADHYMNFFASRK